ncbi:MAG: tryptophan-rich sensory protein [Clostridia bacterium]|nr:tryptophan-rich sensory protein [Clostridia bacterium]
MKIRWKTLILAIAIPLIVGGLSALITMDSMGLFDTVDKPPLSPPAWLFPVVWTALYILMGIASYIVFEKTADMVEKSKALRVYFLQLAFNFLWSVFFFNFELYLFSFFWLLALWVLIIVTAVRFYRISKVAGYLMIPYILWVTFAGYLNLGIAILN